MSRGWSRTPPHLHNFPPRRNPCPNLGCSSCIPSSIGEYPGKKWDEEGGSPYPPPRALVVGGGAPDLPLFRSRPAKGRVLGAQPLGYIPHRPLPPYPTRPPPLTLRGRGLRGYPPYTPQKSWGQGGSRYPKGPFPAQVLAALGISNAIFHIFAVALQGELDSGLVAVLLSPSPVEPSGMILELSLLHLYFACGVAGDADLSHIWEEVAHVKGWTEGLTTLN